MQDRATSRMISVIIGKYVRTNLKKRLLVSISGSFNSEEFRSFAEAERLRINHQPLVNPEFWLSGVLERAGIYPYRQSEGKMPAALQPLPPSTPALQSLALRSKEAQVF